MTNNIMATMMQFRAAVTEAQSRTGDKSISTAVKNGKVQVCSVVFDSKGKSAVTPMSDFLGFDEALAYVNGLGA